MVVVNIFYKTSIKRIYFLKKTFLLANNSMKIVLGIT